MHRPRWSRGRTRARVRQFQFPLVVAHLFRSPLCRCPGPLLSSSEKGTASRSTSAKSLARDYPERTMNSIHLLLVVAAVATAINAQGPQFTVIPTTYTSAEAPGQLWVPGASRPLRQQQIID